MIMIERLKSLISRHVLLVPIIFSAIVLCGFIGVGAYYTYKNNQTVTSVPKKIVKDAAQEAKQAAEEVADDPAAEEKTEEFVKNPPKTSAGKISTNSVKTKSGTAVVVSTGGAATDSTKIQSFASKSATSNFSYIDKTGRYPQLGAMIKEYLETKMLKGTELSYFYELDLVDCPECDYGGYWTGSYINDGADITKAFGYITLNIGPYKDSLYRDDYMKLIFSHEYGHHYTMYHRWVDMDIEMGQRFPSQYYSIRPLAYGVTATDYSLGWANCDAEVIAEDYSYFYSGFGYSGIASIHGYPSNPSTKNYLISMNSTVAEGAQPTEEANPPVQPQNSDTTPPTVRITSPANNSTVTNSISITANANDDIGVTKVAFYVDGQLISEEISSPYNVTWASNSFSDGIHSLRARAYDGAGNYADHSISISINNSIPDDIEKPMVSIAEPTTNNYEWTGSKLRLHATASDNVTVVKIELLINDSLVAEENDGDITRIWMSNGTPPGTYILKARAYDAAGNWAETTLTIIKS